MILLSLHHLANRFVKPLVLENIAARWHYLIRQPLTNRRRIQRFHPREAFQRDEHHAQFVAAALVLRVKANGAQLYESLARFDTGTNRFVSIPIDLGEASDQLFLILFGTGMCGRALLAGAVATMGGANAEVLYVGAQGGLVGLNQANVRIPRGLLGRGEVNVALSVDGIAANVVTVGIK